MCPAQITINVSENAVVPACPVPGHAWKHVQHDPKVTWLATWTENVMGQHKYVFLAASSGFKGESDLKKYEKVSRGACVGVWSCWARFGLLLRRTLTRMFASLPSSCVVRLASSRSSWAPSGRSTRR